MKDRSIILSLAAVMICTILMMIAAIVIPFDVEKPASIQQISGVVEVHSPGSLAATLNPREKNQLNSGDRILVPPGSTTTLAFFNGGHALLEGPARLTLITSYRHATVLGHTSDSRHHEDVLTLEQSQGTIRYYFDHTSPTKITIELPDGHFIPNSPCWIISIGTDQQISSNEISC
jgi:hypothetical protein